MILPHFVCCLKKVIFEDERIGKALGVPLSICHMVLKHPLW